MQPALVKTALPAVGSPFLYCGGHDDRLHLRHRADHLGRNAARRSSRRACEVEQPAAKTRTIASGARRRTSAESIRRGRTLTGRVKRPRHGLPHPYNPRHEAQILRPRRRPHAADDLHDGPARPALRRLRRRPLLGAERRPRADARDRRRTRVLPVLHLGQARARRGRARKVVSREEAPALHDMVERLCAMADLPKPKVAIMDTPVPNAFATGRSPKHAAVCVTTGLWERLEPKEIEGVLAHELSHVANRDVLIMTVASFFAMLAAMLTRFGLYAGMLGRRREPRQQQRAADLADRVRRLDHRLRDQLRPDPHDLALPRVRRRPRLGADHRRARVPDERAAEDLVPDDADPEPGSPPGRGHERVLHHPGQGEGHASPSSSWTTRRSRSASPRSPRSRARWAARSPSHRACGRMGRGRPLRTQEARRAEGRPALLR